MQQLSGVKVTIIRVFGIRIPAQTLV